MMAGNLLATGGAGILGGHLVDAYETYLTRSRQLGGRVFNMGGGPGFTMSLLDLLSFLERDLGRKAPVSYAGWRSGDQKVYISDIRKAKDELSWMPKVRPDTGVQRIRAGIGSETFAETPGGRGATLR